MMYIGAAANSWTRLSKNGAVLLRVAFLRSLLFSH